MFWDWREFRTLYKREEMNAVKAALQKEHIPYKVKNNTRLGANRSYAGTTGMKTYTLYGYRNLVKKEDLEKAAYFI